MTSHKKSIIEGDRIVKKRNHSKFLSSLAMAAVFFCSSWCLMSNADAEDSAAGAQAPQVKIPQKDKFYLFLLAGQSNMAGRGTVENEDKVVNPRVLALSKEGKWVPAVDPIHFDKPSAGVGPGRSFALALMKKSPSWPIITGASGDFKSLRNRAINSVNRA